MRTSNMHEHVQEVRRHRFWMVKGAGPANSKHDTEQSAETEARRLASLHPGQWFYVVAAVTAIRYPRPDIDRLDLTDEIPF